MAKTLYILDGHSQIYRAYHALRPGSMTGPGGEPTWATYVFTTMLLRIVNEKRPDYLAVAVDGPKADLERTRAFPEYKANRPPMPDDLPPQEKRIFQIIDAMAIPILRAPGQEADDVMATAAARLAGDDLRVVLVSRDKDLDQLVGEHVVLYDPAKDEVLDAAAIEAAKGYPPAKATEVQTLMGDSTDNIPGIPGVGPKRAARLVADYGTAEEVVAHADDLTPKLRENVLAFADSIPLTRRLVTLDRDVDIELDLDAMRFGGAGAAALRALFEEIGFQSLLGRIGELPQAPGALPAPDALSPTVAAPTARGQTAAGDFRYECIDTAEGLAAVVEQAAKVKRLAVDTETTSTQPMRAELVGVSLAWTPGEALYVPVDGPLGATTLERDLVREALAPVLADEGIEKIGHNIKYDMIVLAEAGMPIAGPVFDTMVAAHVLDSTRLTYKLDALAAELLHHRCIPIEDVIGRGRDQVTMNAVPVDVVVPYAAEDADVALRLADVLAEQLAREGLTDLFAKLEMPLVPVLTEMERTGIIVDPEELNRQAGALSGEAEALREQIIDQAGHPLNVDSPKQLAVVLFDEMKLPVRRRTKTGPSTNSSVLQELAVTHRLPALVLDYRKLTKLLGTYLKALGQHIHPRTNRVHTSFHQAGTATGRLSSSDPNLQNIPIRTDLGRKIRAAFVAPKGHVLLSADYSQVELRVLAHLCGDETLCAAFAAGEDIHRAVAAEVFSVAPDEVTPEQRGRAKTVNFGIIYGQTAYGLSVSLRIPRKKAAEFITRYRSRFPQIGEFLNQCVRAAKQQGYVETIFGRRRRIAEIDARNPQRRAAAERLAINSVVQGSAADLIKQAMVNLARRIEREGRPSRMLLQIHDELLFEVPAEAVRAETDVIVEEMTGAIELRVPLKVDVGMGRNWMAAK